MKRKRCRYERKKMGKKRKEKVCTKAEKESHHYQSIFNFQITFNATTTVVVVVVVMLLRLVCVCVALVTKSTHSISIWLDVHWSISSARHLPFEASLRIDAKVFTLLPFFLFCFSFDRVRIFFHLLLLFFVQFALLLLLPLYIIQCRAHICVYMVGFFPWPKTKNLIKFPTIGFRKTFKAHSKYYPLTTLLAARRESVFSQSRSAWKLKGLK